MLHRTERAIEVLQILTEVSFLESLPVPGEYPIRGMFVRYPDVFACLPASFLSRHGFDLFLVTTFNLNYRPAYLPGGSFQSLSS